ncbi:MAG TPA: hypothetical protein VE046_09900 [Steroidobacteraceae bacterium]|nr:hypothetical protein [Steroidobacteraceae bacterium]
MNTMNKFEANGSEGRARRRRTLGALVGACALAFAMSGAHADSRDQAKRIHDRIAGVPPDAATLDAMAADIQGGNPAAAAQKAMDASAFYTVTLKNFVTPWTNRDQTVFAPLNDYTATVIGMVRDDVPFNTVLSADLAYVGNSGLGLPAYSVSNNDHYQQLEDRGLDLKASLVSSTQSSLNGLPAAATAGVITSRAAAQAFFIAGTNRAMFRFTLLNHLCKDMENVHDTTRPPDKIRQDVARSPGGDSRIFLNGCIGCHSGMDPMAEAFAYYNFDETQARIIYTAGAVQPKYLINSDNFKSGFVTPDDHWENRWRAGPNQLLGWDLALPGSGNGAKSMGQELASSDQFAHCQAEKVFKNVCLRAPGNIPDRGKVTSMAASFKSGGYKMKQLFADAAVYCMGD